jgi:hypothetical protein
MQASSINRNDVRRPALPVEMPSKAIRLPSGAERGK